MLAAHKSQKAWLDESQGLDSYIQSMRQLSRDVGRMSGQFTYAEGWRRHSHLGFCAAAADPLVQALSPERVLAAPRTADRGRRSACLRRLAAGSRSRLAVQ